MGRGSALVGIIALVATMSSCADASDRESPPQAQPPFTGLVTIAVQPTADAQATTTKVSCAEEVDFCHMLSAQSLQANPPGTVCTDIYGGPQVATVSGVMEGKPLKLTFTRSNGCEIARWDAFAKTVESLSKPLTLPSWQAGA